jgi:hypothetical protein
LALTEPKLLALISCACLIFPIWLVIGVFAPITSALLLMFKHFKPRSVHHQL